MRLGKCMLLFCFMLTAAVGFAQTTKQAQQEPSTGDQRKTEPLAPRNLMQETEKVTNTGPSDSLYFKGKIRFLTLRRDMKANVTASGASATSSARSSAANKESEETKVTQNEHLPFWQGSFRFLGASFPFRMIGTNPSKGSATTEVSVVIIPIQFTFADGTQLSAAQNACGDTESPVSRILKSPLFKKSAFSVGGTLVGNTQYIDAFQRANFWSDVTRSSPDYHVLLSPNVAATAPFVLPGPPVGFTVQGPCAPVGFEDIGDLDPRVQSLINTLDIPGNVLPVFVMYNTFGTQGGGCCVLGYHSVTFDTNRHPYVVASYSDPNLFIMPVEDIHALSHELGEWMDDPFVRSFVPSWGNVGQVGGCSFAMETGDPVTGIAFELNMNGFTYHPEDLVFLPWFSRESPSSSVNGQYTFLNSFPKPQGICGQ